MVRLERRAGTRRPPSRDGHRWATHLRTLDLTQEDFDDYYNGYANRTLWPLFHYRARLVDFSRRDLAGYRRVNRLFAARWRRCCAGRPDLGARLPPDPARRAAAPARATQPIGFFLHMPLPAAELLRVLP